MLARYSGTQLDVFYNANALQTTNDSVAIEGVLSSDGLTLLLCSHNSGCTLLKRFCVRFNDTELRIIIYPLGDGHKFYDVLVGETSEGLKLVIESHRCYTSDMQANASALKVRMNSRNPVFSLPLEYRDSIATPSSAASCLMQTSYRSLAYSPVTSFPMPAFSNLLARKTSPDTSSVALSLRG